MKLEKTCGNCPNLKVTGVGSFAAAYCGLTDYIIPHGSEGVDFTFWRVPIECPRTEGVKKSEKQAPKKEWVNKVLSDLTS